MCDVDEEIIEDYWHDILMGMKVLLYEEDVSAMRAKYEIDEED